jgi:hypothetical protein
MTIYLWINRQEGPFDESSIEVMLRGGTISGDTLAWTEGLADWVPLASLVNSSQLINERSITEGEGLLEALQVTTGHVRGSDLVAVFEETVPSPASDSQLAPTSQSQPALYRWPQFGHDLGIALPGWEPPVRTIANGTPIGREEFLEILQKANLGDRDAILDLSYICDENADIQPNPVVAARLRLKSEEYHEILWAQIGRESQHANAAKNPSSSTPGSLPVNRKPTA